MHPKNFIREDSLSKKNRYLVDDRFDFLNASFYPDTPKIGFEIERSSINDLFPLKERNADVAVAADKCEAVTIADQVILLPVQLNDLKDEVESSKEILDLDDNWDYEGAKKIDESVYLSSIKFLISYSSYIYNNSRIIIDTPEINPCSDGSIDLSWRSTKLRLLINFKLSTDQVKANFYGDLYDPEKSRQGYIDLTQFDTSFAEWMKQLEK